MPIDIKLDTSSALSETLGHRRADLKCVGGDPGASERIGFRGKSIAPTWVRRGDGAISSLDVALAPVLASRDSRVAVAL